MVNVGRNKKKKYIISIKLSFLHYLAVVAINFENIGKNFLSHKKARPNNSCCNQFVGTNNINVHNVISLINMENIIMKFHVSIEFKPDFTPK